MLRSITVITLLGISFAAAAGWFGESNYDDCILENIKGAQNPEAVSAVKQDCRTKFPDRPDASAPKSDDCPSSSDENGYGAYHHCKEKVDKVPPTPEK